MIFDPVFVLYCCALRSTISAWAESVGILLFCDTTCGLILKISIGSVLYE